MAYYVTSGVVSNGLTLQFYEFMYISSGGIASNTTLNAGGRMHISSGGMANYTTINDAGDMFISSGGVANSTTLNFGGKIYIYNNCYAYKTSMTGGTIHISSGGRTQTTYMTGGHMCIYDGGTANYTMLQNSCTMIISSGGTAKYSELNAACRVSVCNGGTVDGTDVYKDGLLIISNGGVANSTNVYGGSMHISNGGVANSTTVNSGGEMAISNGGVANSTTVSSGSMYISSGGVANSTTVNEYGSMHISSGGVANSTTVNSGGDMNIFSGGVTNSTTVKDRGSMSISSGGTATDITALSGAGLGITVASDTYIQGSYNGSSFEMKDAFISDYTVNSGGEMAISSGGTANRTTVNEDGCMVIRDGGVANSTTVNSGGEMAISSGGVHTGSLQIDSGASVYVYTGGIINLIVADRKTSDGYLINNLSAIQGDATYTITLADNQKIGVYKLAQSAEKFTGTLTVGNSNAVIGDVGVNGKLLFTQDRVYLLNQNCGNLTLIVKDHKHRYSGDDVDNLVFISSKYNAKTTGKKQDGITLTYNSNAFDSIGNVANASEKIVVVVDSKVNGNDYADLGKVAAVVMIESEKTSGNSCTYKVAYTAKGTLNITANTGSTEFLRFTTVSIEGATVGNVRGGKLTNNEELKITVDKKGNTTENNKTTYSQSATGKFAAINGSAGVVENYATVNLTGATVSKLSGGTVSKSDSSKIVDSASKDQNTLSASSNIAASGKVTLTAQAHAGSIEGYSNVTLTDSVAGDVTNFTSKDSKSATATYEEAKVTRNVTLSHSETTAGTLKATNSTLGNVTGFATVTLKNVTEAGDFRRVDFNGNKYSTIKKTLTIKTNKDGSVAGTYSKTETFTRAGKFTATGSTVGDIENFSNVTLDGSKAEAISNFVEAKIVTKYTATWDNVDQYGRPDDYAIDLQGWNEEEPVITDPLNGSVTLKNGASAGSITNFKSVTMTASEVGTIENVEKVTVNKGDSAIGSYTGTDGNDTLSIAKGAVLTAEEIVLNDAKDTLALNGTLILTGSNFDVTKITGKGEIAATATVWDALDMDETVLNLGETSKNFRGTAYENADDSAPKAVKWDGKTEYNGWLGDWSGAKEGSDKVDYIKFKAQEGDELTVSGDVDWTLLDKKGNEIQEIAAGVEYTIQITNKKEGSTSYTIELA